MTLHAEKVYAKFRDIADSVERLRAFNGISSGDFLSDRDKQDIAGFRLIVATEAAIDLCLHVAATHFLATHFYPFALHGCFTMGT